MGYLMNIVFKKEF